MLRKGRYKTWITSDEAMFHQSSTWQNKDAIYFMPEASQRRRYFTKVVGNKCDIPEERRQVKKEDVNEWVFCELPKIRAKIIECSAKDNINIREIFRSFLQLAKIALPTESNALRRRSSTHVSIGRTPRFNSSLSPAREQQAESSPETTQQQSSSQKSSKPRSRSLIRRTSKKSNKLKDPAATPGCSADGI
ncbi:UNVERIFIED_CONTAM: hypothetical protein NCL1_03198 [Trichonephila clavipes]